MKRVLWLAVFFLLIPALLLAAASEPREEDQARRELLNVIKQQTARVKKLMNNETEALAVIDRLKEQMMPYIEDKDVSRKALKFISYFAYKGCAPLRVEAAAFVGRFADNPKALQILSQGVRLLTVRDRDWEEAAVAMIDNIPNCGRFNPMAVNTLKGLFASKYNASLEVKGHLVMALGNIRCMASIDALISLLPKICPYPEDPNPHVRYLFGDDSKYNMWQGLYEEFYEAMYSLTGEDQRSTTFKSVYWKYSDWKKWARKNRKFMVRKFKAEQEEAERAKEEAKAEAIAEAPHEGEMSWEM